MVRAVVVSVVESYRSTCELELQRRELTRPATANVGAKVWLESFARSDAVNLASDAVDFGNSDRAKLALLLESFTHVARVKNCRAVNGFES